MRGSGNDREEAVKSSDIQVGASSTSDIRVAPGREDVLAAGARFLRVSGKAVSRARKGIMGVGEYLGFSLRDVGRGELERMFAETETVTSGDGHPVKAEELRHELLGVPGEMEREIAVERICRAYDRFGCPAFVLVSGYDGERRCFHVRALETDDVSAEDELRLEHPGAGAFMTMLSAYVERLRYVPYALGEGEPSVGAFASRGIATAGGRAHYSELGYRLATEGVESLPPFDGEANRLEWCVHFANARFVHVTSYLEWFGEEPKSHEDANELSELVRRMSAGTICRPQPGAGIAEGRRYCRDVQMLDALWYGMRAPLKKVQDANGVFRPVVMDCAPEEFFADMGGPQMVEAIRDGVPIEDVIA